jgi:hypothetical protein
MAPRKRRNSNPLATVNEPRWLKTFDRCRTELTVRRIEPLTDLTQLMRDEAAAWAAAGWTVEGDARWGGFFVNRNGERIEVLLTPVEHPAPGHDSRGFGEKG